MNYIQQMDETDCGAACFAMVASHYNFKSQLHLSGKLREQIPKGLWLYKTLIEFTNQGKIK
ncbi:MAG: cysteine peptidase family C39 domain-containing protein [Treponema sp.]|nr:cysteine peptidase family C39 domain-containing protein [Treponema sp.]